MNEHEINESSTQVNTRLSRNEYARLSKMAALFDGTFSDVMRSGLAKMWAEFGGAAEELAQAHTAIARRLEGTEL